MFKPITPKNNEIISFSNHVLIWIQSGYGIIEVDFQQYSDFSNRLIFLGPGQNLRLIYGEVEAVLLEFDSQIVTGSKESRVLFKHLVSLGYIDFNQNQLWVHKLLAKPPAKILDISSNQWFWQNPFNANKEEYMIIFDLKDLIDQRFKENLSTNELLSSIHADYFEIHRLLKNRIGVSLKKLATGKVLTESKKEIAFTAKPIQEIAYDLGFKDPAYFNRFFKKSTSFQPGEFRKRFGQQAKDHFIEDLQHLIQQHYKESRSTAFYADKMYMSTKTLSRKVKTQLHTTVGELVRAEVISQSRQMLLQASVKETAFELGFEEANHFSAFFKKYSGISPSQFQSEKYQS